MTQVSIVQNQKDGLFKHGLWFWRSEDSTVVQGVYQCPDNNDRFKYY